MWYPGSGVVLDLSIPDLCHLSYFYSLYKNEIGQSYGAIRDLINFCSDMEAMEQAKKEKEAEKAAAAAAAAVTTSAVPYTPDYAAGLVSPAPAVSIVIPRLSRGI